MLYIQYIYSHDILLISQNWLQNSKNIYLEKDISYIWKIHNGARWELVFRKQKGKEIYRIYYSTAYLRIIGSLGSIF